MRERILEAAERVLRAKGLAGATTKEIARAAGCSEGSLYNYFEDKEGLFLAVLAERLPGLLPLIGTLHESVGSGDVRENLAEVARTALRFYREILPMTGAICSSPDLVDDLRSRGMGPHRANQGIASYLRREQEAGRLRADADPEATAALLLGACHQRALHSPFHDEPDVRAADESFAAGLVDALWAGVRPGDESAS